MNGKYGFSGGIDLPKTTPAPKPRPKVDGNSLSEAVKQGAYDAPETWSQTQRAARQDFDTWPQASRR
jgi:hypothetical protein